MPDTAIRIGIDARPLAGPPCGYTAYLCSVIGCLRNAGFELTLLTNAPLRAQYADAAGLPVVLFGRASHILWELRDLASVLATQGFDIYFTGANRGIPWRKRRNTRYVLGLLDVIPYKFFRSYFLDWRTWRKRMPINGELLSQLISIARADAILTISHASARDIHALFGRRDVTPCLIRLKEAEMPRVMTLPQFVYVGGADVRKRIDVLLHAFASFLSKHPQFSLVLIGSNYGSYLPLINALGLNDRVVLTGYVDDDAKYRIIGESVAMVYPSLYEGYGMAIAEGFQAGVPVIAGRGGSQEQVAGDGARLVDPSSPDDIAAAMEEMLTPQVRAEWVERGRRQLAVLTDPEVERELVSYFTKQGQLARTP